MRYAYASETATLPYAVALTHLSERLSDEELRARYPATSGTLIAVRGVYYYFDATLESVRVDHWHDTFNSAVIGSLAGKRHRQDAVQEAVIVANLAHNPIPQIP